MTDAEFDELERLLSIAFPDKYANGVKFGKRKCRAIWLEKPACFRDDDGAWLKAFYADRAARKLGKRNVAHPIKKAQGEQRSLARKPKAALDVGELDKTLQQSKKTPNLGRLLAIFLNKSGMTPPQLYTKVGMSRQAYNKVSNCAVKSGHAKETLFKLIVGLELCLDDATNFLETAGYAFSARSPRDVIVRFCIERGRATMLDIDRCLVHAGLRPMFSEL